jgi:hypothetical protein
MLLQHGSICLEGCYQLAALLFIGTANALSVEINRQHGIALLRKITGAGIFKFTATAPRVANQYARCSGRFIVKNQAFIVAAIKLLAD